MYYVYIFTTLILLLVTAFLYFYLFLKRSHKFFDKYGIPYLKPHWLYGSIADTASMKKPIWQVYQDIHENHPNDRFAGLYNFHKPAVLIRDPELIKTILIKDFSNFKDRGLPKNEDEPILKNLFNLEGDEWRTLRTKLASTFTSGKMKMMFPLLKKCAEDFKPVLDEYYKNDQEFEAKELCARYTTDAIGSCAFGIDTHCLQNPESEFRKMGQRIFKPRWQALFRIFFPNLPAACVKFFKLQYLEQDTSEYFSKIVKDVIKYREENNIVRGDFLDILIAMKNQNVPEKYKDQQDEANLAKAILQPDKKLGKNDFKITIEEIVAQCFIFFTGGFEGASNGIMFLLFALAQHPEIQNQLRQEILSALEANGGEFTYELMKSIPYLEMVIDETFRRYPAGGFLVRVSNENYKIPESNAIIKKGTPVLVSVLGLHRDIKYFEKPDDFYPEHFTTEAKLQRHNFAFIPFGEGPRVCIAERFARMQIIVGAIYLLKDFSFEVSPKTKVPFEYSAAGAVDVKGGVWLKCRPYNKEGNKT